MSTSVIDANLRIYLAELEKRIRKLENDLLYAESQIRDLENRCIDLEREVKQ